MSIHVTTFDELDDDSQLVGDGFAQCAICGAYHTAPYAQLAVDSDGKRWDVCTGPCAEEAGITERCEEPPPAG